MKWLGAGDFNRRIVVEYITSYTTDTSGADIPVWSTLATIWANVGVNSGREFWASRKTQAEWDGLFKVRCNSLTITITPNERVLYKNRYYNILSVSDPEEAHREIHLETKEIK